RLGAGASGVRASALPRADPSRRQLGGARQPAANERRRLVHHSGHGIARFRATALVPDAAARRPGHRRALTMTSTPDRRVSAVPRDGLTTAPATPGLVRELAFDTERGMLVRARAAGGIASGWHHHGDREVLGHVLRGRARFEFGPDGAES